MAIKEPLPKPPEALAKEADPDISVVLDGFKAMGFGGLKALKGIPSLVAGIAMGASGLGAKEVYEILNSPLPDWIRLWKEKQQEISEHDRELDRAGVKKWLYGAARCMGGFFTNLITSPLNAAKEVIVGGFQAAFGGIAVVALLKHYFGVTKEVAQAALKTGHPIGLMLGAASEGIDKLDAFCRKLEPQLRKYESLGKVGLAAVKKVINKGDIQRGVEQDADVVGQALSQQMKRKDLKGAAEKATHLQGIGINPKRLIFEDGKILLKNVPVGMKLQVMQAILKNNPKFGLIARAKSSEDALRKLIAHRDPEIINRLTAVILPDNKRLSPKELGQLRKEALEAVEKLAQPESSHPVTTAFSQHRSKQPPSDVPTVPPKPGRRI